jgi:hypothetical protein
LRTKASALREKKDITMRFEAFVCGVAVASSAFAGLSVSSVAGGDAEFSQLTNGGALERAVAEGRTGTPGNWQMGIWERGGVGSPKATAQFGLVNGAAQNISISWDGVSTISYTANGVTIGWNQVSGSFTDIFIRVRSVANSTLELGNLSLTTGGPAFNVGTLSTTGAVPAEYLRVQNDGQAIPAFTLSGTHRLSWTSANPPSGSNLAYQVKFSNVVPTPGAMAVLGLGGLVATRRRRA